MRQNDVIQIRSACRYIYICINKSKYTAGYGNFKFFHNIPVSFAAYVNAGELSPLSVECYRLYVAH